MKNLIGASQIPPLLQVAEVKVIYQSNFPFVFRPPKQSDEVTHKKM